MKFKFPHYTQLDAMDCGPTCLRMIAKHHGRSYTLQTLREKSFLTREGVSMLGIEDEVKNQVEEMIKENTIAYVS